MEIERNSMERLELESRSDIICECGNFFLISFRLSNLLMSATIANIMSYGYSCYTTESMCTYIIEGFVLTKGKPKLLKLEL